MTDRRHVLASRRRVEALRIGRVWDDSATRPPTPLSQLLRLFAVIGAGLVVAWFATHVVG